MPFYMRSRVGREDGKVLTRYSLSFGRASECVRCSGISVRLPTLNALNLRTHFL